jgi:hypothetical protein
MVADNLLDSNVLGMISVDIGKAVQRQFKDFTQLGLRQQFPRSDTLLIQMLVIAFHTAPQRICLSTQFLALVVDKQ